jgi:hypothetical protein
VRRFPRLDSGTRSNRCRKRHRWKGLCSLAPVRKDISQPRHAVPYQFGYRVRNRSQNGDRTLEFRGQESPFCERFLGP